MNVEQQRIIHEHLEDEGILDAFAQFARNERWGTCADCPRTSKFRYGHPAFPEFCEFTDRYDHQLTLDELVDAYRRYGGKS